jgi:hypothetical protein
MTVMNPTSSLRGLIWMPLFYSAAVVAITFAMSHGDVIDMGSAIVWFPVCFFCVALAQVRLLRRIEALEVRHAAPPAANRSKVSDANE